jgi:uncharacterized protein
MEYPDDFDPAWIPGNPEFAYAANGVSLMMPYYEPYFIRSIRSTLDLLDEPLRARTESYVGQEQQHQLQHLTFNQLVHRRYPTVESRERRLKWVCERLWRKRSQKFNVAFAAGSETIAFVMARWAETHLGHLFIGADPQAATLFLWHLAEEVEHKTAAYDVFETTDGSRLRYAWATSVSVAIIFWFITSVIIAMLRRDGRLFHPLVWWRLTKMAIGLAFVLLPTLFVSALPSHHPNDLADPAFLPSWLQSFDPETATMPIWQPPPLPERTHR